MKARKVLMTAAVVSTSALLLTGCLDDKKDRITKYEPGVYKGKKDVSLTDAQERALQRRALLQGGVIIRQGGPSGGAPKRNVRPPASSAPGIDLNALSNRAKKQRSP